MSTPSDALLHRLRADIELKAQLIKALRTEGELVAEAERENTLLLAAASAALLSLNNQLALLLAEGYQPAAQRAAEHLKAACADFADFTAAKAGQLVLQLRPLHVRTLLARVVSRHQVELRVAANVPERVTADEAQLSRILTCLIAGAEAHSSVPLVLEVKPAEVGGDTAADRSVALEFLLSRDPHVSDDPARAIGSVDDEPLARLRAALASNLMQLMNARLAGNSLVVPVRSAVDQAHTGMFRLAASEPASEALPPPSFEATVATVTPIAERYDDDEVSIDRLYLDRQLGSLAPVILERTGPAFVAHAQRRMADLHVAQECEDLTRLRRIAHAWRGSALSVGACELAAMLDAIEKQAAAGRLPGPSPIWQVRKSVDRVVRVLERAGSSGGVVHERG